MAAASTSAAGVDNYLVTIQLISMVPGRGSCAEQIFVFYVCDNGMGIAPEHRERIFNLFSQLNPESAGSGLGLSLVKKIVTIYRGRIWVEAAGAGQGSCFYFTLPVALVTVTTKR